jgi:folate-dependent phosphoribosylglycinamide formyltransferase PurN
MKIDQGQLIGKETDINAMRQEIVHIKEKAIDKVISYENLLDSEYIIDLDDVKLAFTNDHRRFEMLLFKIHFKRNRRFSNKQRHNILMFLSIGYHYTRDIRYFNEFLWFYTKDIQSQRLWFLSLDNFFFNLSKTNHHHFPLCDVREIQDFIRETNELIISSRKADIDPSLRIGLLGSPTFSPMVRERLINDGFTVRNYHIPYHPDKKINFVFKTKMAFRLFCLMKKVNCDFVTLDYHYNDSKIGEILKEEKLDIGFHKFAFIIRRNIIDALRIGLINDHLAILPYIRGRSTIEYSLLLNIPICATDHLVDENVDSGDIVSIYQYPSVEAKYSTVKQIQKFIRNERDFRAADSIEILSRIKRPIVKNKAEKGLTFYSIHPSLRFFIEKNILKPSTNCNHNGAPESIPKLK